MVCGTYFFFLFGLNELKASKSAPEELDTCERFLCFMDSIGTLCALRAPFITAPVVPD